MKSVGPGRLDQDMRRPEIHRDTCETVATVKLLSEVALGKLQCSPFPFSIISRIREERVTELERGGYPLDRQAEDHSKLPFDFQDLDGLLRAS